MSCYFSVFHISCRFSCENLASHIVEYGPLNMIYFHALSKISAILQEISTDDILKSWWTAFSTWGVFEALRCFGTVKVGKYMTENFENLQDF